jgi:hypothetical protein
MWSIQLHQWITITVSCWWCIQLHQWTTITVSCWWSAIIEPLPWPALQGVTASPQHMLPLPMRKSSTGTSRALSSRFSDLWLQKLQRQALIATFTQILPWHLSLKRLWRTSKMGRRVKWWTFGSSSCTPLSFYYQLRGQGVSTSLCQL